MTVDAKGAPVPTGVETGAHVAGGSEVGSDPRVPLGRGKRAGMLLRAAGAVLVGLLIAAGITTASADDGRRMDGWYAYDYRAGLDVEPAVNVMREATEPIVVRDDRWTETRIEVDAVEWRNSWRWDPASAPDLKAVLTQANSYGIGFVGFDTEPTGRLGMRGFRVGC